MKHYSYYGVDYLVYSQSHPAGRYTVVRFGKKRKETRHFNDSLVFDACDADECDGDECAHHRSWARKMIRRLFF